MITSTRSRGSILLALLIGLAVPASQSSQGGEPSQNGRVADQKKPFTDDDFQIFEVVLLDLLQTPDFRPMILAREKRKDIVLHNKTAGKTNVLGHDYYPDNDQPKEPPTPNSTTPAMKASLKARNPQEKFDLSGFQPRDPRILVRDPGDPKRRFAEKFPTARGYVEFCLPGYSEDGQDAILCGWYGPTAHGGIVTYRLKKKEGRWIAVDHWFVNFS